VHTSRLKKRERKFPSKRFDLRIGKYHGNIKIKRAKRKIEEVVPKGLHNFGSTEK